MSQTIKEPNSAFVDFKQVKASVNLVDVLERYELMSKLTCNGDRLSGACPIHQGSNVTQFRVSISKNCFNCFGSCKRGGNVIDFVALMEDVPFRDAALLLQERFMPVSQHPSAKTARPAFRRQAPSRETGASSEAPDDDKDVNPPLSFELKSLNAEHPYLNERGITPEAIKHFGLGHCSRGYLRNHIAIPIHNREGELVAYAGRWPGEPPEDGAKYKLPKGFKKSLEVFNLHRALHEPEEWPLVLVEGFFDCIALWESGIRRCVALMGSHLGSAQMDAICRTVDNGSEIEILFDADNAGQKGVLQVTKALKHHANIRNINLPKGIVQVDELSTEEIATLFE